MFFFFFRLVYRNLEDVQVFDKHTHNTQKLVVVFTAKTNVHEQIIIKKTKTFFNNAQPHTHTRIAFMRHYSEVSRRERQKEKKIKMMMKKKKKETKHTDLST